MRMRDRKPASHDDPKADSLIERKLTAFDANPGQEHRNRSRRSLQAPSQGGTRKNDGVAQVQQAGEDSTSPRECHHPGNR